MKKLLSLFIFFSSAVLVAQEQDSAFVDVVNFRGDLNTGEVFSMDNTSLTFLEVISDSRCPRQVTCIWPGEAKVLVGITQNGKYTEKEIVISGTGTPFLDIQNFDIDVFKLTPYPETAKKIAPAEYQINYSISAPVKN